MQVAPVTEEKQIHTESIAYLSALLPSLLLTQRQLCDVELLLNGGFAPLTGFMNEADYDNVLASMRLADGSLWPMPIALDIDAAFAKDVQPDQKIALRDAEGLLIAILTVNDCWQIDKKREALSVFGTLDDAHPSVAYLNQVTKDFYIGGTLTPVTLPHHYDFTHLRRTPSDLKAHFKQCGITDVVAFQTRNPMHRAHQELTLRAIDQTGAHLLIHPVVGMTKPGDIEYYLRVRCYEHVLKVYQPQAATLSLLPLAMRMAGPKEALWHALIRKNYGCTHFIVGRDHAGPGKDKQGNPFYDPYAAQTLTMQHQQEIGVEIVPFQEMAYSHTQQRYFPVDVFPVDETPASISGTELRQRLQRSEDIPSWFSYPAVMAELRKAYPPKNQQGFTVFLTGLPSAGKSTLANALSLKLREMTDREISILDGDVIRTHLSKGLGFSREDRELNISRVGFVASRITKHRGIAICALVAPFRSAREQVRRMVTEVGGYIEVHVATALSICEQRDRKGMYKQARAGLISQFTGVSDVYEEPLEPEICLDTAVLDPVAAIDKLVHEIKLLGYI
ncbi:MAG TPA: bifunctional sulfate adenylyltransferase/adenylylsulfate kinase [Gammaproteobacteria bacterium]|jgi:sulfate adenylyltransferase|nr:bifunctional sulfate adenylyltransferase/adenylylsulfate kinase [Gammaproteobacteria bacterium]